MSRLFSREELRLALAALVDLLVEAKVSSEIYVVGGAAFLLRGIDRRMTVDIDAKVTNATAVLAIAERLAMQNNWPSDWFNNSARIFVPFDTKYDLWQLYLEKEGVRVYLAPLDDLLIMKLNAARENRDDEDLAFLFERLGLRTLAEIEILYESRSPGEVLPEKAIRLVRNILSTLHD